MNTRGRGLEMLVLTVGIEFQWERWEISGAGDVAQL